MRKLTVLTFISLDGVMQAPGGKGEDPSGGFNLEGWTVPFFDEALGLEMGSQMTPPFDLLLGRMTYDVFAGYWPAQGADDPINRATKYVVTSHPLTADWAVTVPISGDIPAAIRRLKEQDGPPLQVHGSSQLIQTLLQHDLVDELWLKTFPVVLGRGKRLFGGGTIPGSYDLTGSFVTPAGVVVASYRRAGAVQVGTFA